MRLWVSVTGQAKTSTARTLRSAVAATVRFTGSQDDITIRRRARRQDPRTPRTLAHRLRFEADLAVLGLQTEVHGFGALLGEDAAGLLGDQLLEAVELHRARFAGLLARLHELIVERLDGLGVGAGVLHPDLGHGGGPGRGAGRRRGPRRRQLVGLEPVDTEGLALFDGPQPLAPQLVERVVAGGQALIAEALAVVADLLVRVLAHQLLHAELELVGRLPLDAAEELVPLDLELPDRLLELVQIVAEWHELPFTPQEDPEQRQPQLAGVGHALAVDQDLGARDRTHDVVQLAQRFRGRRFESGIVADGAPLGALAVDRRLPGEGQGPGVVRPLKGVEEQADPERALAAAGVEHVGHLVGEMGDVLLLLRDHRRQPLGEGLRALTHRARIGHAPRKVNASACIVSGWRLRLPPAPRTCGAACPRWTTSCSSPRSASCPSGTAASWSCATPAACWTSCGASPRAATTRPSRPPWRASTASWPGAWRTPRPRPPSP